MGAVDDYMIGGLLRNGGVTAFNIFVIIVIPEGGTSGSEDSWSLRKGDEREYDKHISQE